MSTLNGIGTLYYDWQANSDSTANATKWFVVFFLPVVPLQRQRLRVWATEQKRSGVLDTLLALTGNGSGFETRIEVLEKVPNSPARILKTYALAYLGVPLITFILPTVLVVGLMLLLNVLGLNVQQSGSFVLPICSILMILWVGVCVASILDRASGRKHVFRENLQSQR